MSDQLPASAAPDVKAAFRALWTEVRKWTGVLNVDLKGRRLINAGASVDDSDYVTRAELQSQQGTTTGPVGSGTALSTANDANVTAALTGSPTVALLRPVILTLGWTGQLGLSRGGTNADLSATGGANKVLKQSSTGAAITVDMLASTNLSDTTTLLRTTTAFPMYAGITTAGWGVPAIYGFGRSVAQVAAVASVATYTVGPADGSFTISANVLVTTATLHNFGVTCAYTDESNTSRTLTLSFSQLAGTFVVAITNVTGVGPYEGVPLHIRCKTATAITLASVGTFTTCQYNVEGAITQIA